MHTSPSMLVASHLIQRADRDRNVISAVKLNLLTYICHGWNLSTYGEPLSLTPIVAKRFGPYLPELAGIEGSTSFAVTDEHSDQTPMEEDQRVAEIVEEVYQGYGGFSDLELFQLTRHQGTPWRAVWDDDDSGEAVISDELIREHYAGFSQTH